MIKTENLQDLFLRRVRTAGTTVTIFLINGFQMRGVITASDNFVICLETDGKQQIIYKHAVSTIVPAQPVQFSAE
jgi:host factor-I protein